MPSSHDYPTRTFPKVILLSGKKGSGKSTLASNICPAHAVEETTLAYSLKQCLSWVFGVDITQLWGEAKETPVWFDPHLTSRQFMQRFGRAIRDIDAQLWLKLWARNYAGYYRVVVSDCRFQNEFDFFTRNYSCLTVRLLRNWNGTDPDESEHGLDSLPNEAFDIVIPDGLTPQGDYEKFVADARKIPGFLL